MICKNCQAEIENNSTMCPYCNVEIKKPNPQLAIILSFIATICCCCFPLGVVGLLFSVKANQQLQSGDYEGARSNTMFGLILAIIGIVIGIIIGVILFVIFGMPMLIHGALGAAVLAS